MKGMMKSPSKEMEDIKKNQIQISEQKKYSNWKIKNHWIGSIASKRKSQ